MYKVRSVFLENGDWSESCRLEELDFLPIRGDVLTVYGYQYKVVRVDLVADIVEVYLD